MAASRDVDKLVFRIPAPALLAAGCLLICVTPVAWAAPGLQALYLLPLGFAWWVLRNRTTVDATRLVARGTFSKRVLAWDDVTAIKVVPKGWLSAVLGDRSQVRLPAVRAGHLPALAAVSGGRFRDPTARPDTDEPGADEPGTAGPAPDAEPADVAAPAAPEPGTAGSAPADPGKTDPGKSDPGRTGSTGAEPGRTGPERAGDGPDGDGPQADGNAARPHGEP